MHLRAEVSRCAFGPGIQHEERVIALPTPGFDIADAEFRHVFSWIQHPSLSFGIVCGASFPSWVQGRGSVQLRRATMLVYPQNEAEANLAPIVLLCSVFAWELFLCLEFLD